MEAYPLFLILLWRQTLSFSNLCLESSVPLLQDEEAKLTYQSLRLLFDVPSSNDTSWQATTSPVLADQLR